MRRGLLGLRIQRGVDATVIPIIINTVSWNGRRGTTRLVIN